MIDTQQQYIKLNIRGEISIIVMNKLFITILRLIYRCWYQRSPTRHSENRNEQGTGKYRRITTLRDSGRKIRRYGR